MHLLLALATLPTPRRDGEPTAPATLPTRSIGVWVCRWGVG
jgi:hypothetical protein